VLRRLLRLLGLARWPMRYLMRHPGVIDELAGSSLLSERFVVADFERDLQLRLASLRSTQEDDDETLLNLLRRAHHAETFRTLARDVEGRITVEQVADDLSLLADRELRVSALQSFTESWLVPHLPEFERRHPGMGPEHEGDIDAAGIEEVLQPMKGVAAVTAGQRARGCDVA